MRGAGSDENDTTDEHERQDPTISGIVRMSWGTVVSDSPVMGAANVAEIRKLAEGITPLDRLEDEHRSQVLCWLSRTDDVFRRARPRTPAQHLVSYFLVVDPEGRHVLLADHIKAGMWWTSSPVAHR